MSYIPLARKYRPTSFADLVGQSHVTATLTRALEQDRVGQAYLFAGLRGVGKTSAARILAKCLNCERGPTAKPCDACANCAQIAAGTGLNVTEIDGASNRGIDEIRSLRDTVAYAPAAGRYHVYIIDEVHMLTPEAFNALLKTLEEPPPHVKFIFATTAPSKVPATILSRCQRFDFRRIESQEIVAVLARIAKAEGIRIDETALFAVAHASDGSLRDAEVVLDQLSSFAADAVTETEVTELLGAVGSDALSRLAGAILSRDLPVALTGMTDQRDRGRDAAQVLGGLLAHMRNLLIIASLRDAPAGSRQDLIARLIDEPAERLAELERQAAGTDAQELLLCVQILAGVFETVRRSPMAQTVLELVVLKLATREAWQSLAGIAKRLDELAASGGPDRPALPGTARAPGPASRPDPAEASGSRARSMPIEPAQDEPKAAAAVQAPDAVSFEALYQTWPGILERVASKKMSLAAYLAESLPVRLDGTTLIVGLPAFSLHQEVLSMRENSQLIERLLKDVCGLGLRVQYETVPELPPSTEDEADPEEPDSPPAEAPEASSSIVKEIVKLFNATVLDTPPGPPSS